MGLEILPVLAAQCDICEKALAVQPEELLLHWHDVAVGEEDFVAHFEAFETLTRFTPFSVTVTPLLPVFI